MDKNIRVSVVMPLRNEEEYVSGCIESLINQTFPKNLLEILIIDGNSSDKTCEIVESYIDKYPYIKLFNNKYKTVPYAMNIGIQNSLGEYIIRLDAHNEYADDYIIKCVEYLDKTGADNVGGPMVAEGKSAMQKIIAASYYSLFALGGGKFHDEKYEGYVDTVYLGAFKKSTLISIEMFDERFVRNQDDELNYRIIKNGGKIFLTPKIRSKYFPRKSLKSLFSQYFQYGIWKVYVIKKHKKPARLTHLIPAAFVIFNFLGIIGSALYKNTYFLYLTILFIYLMLNLYFSFTNKHLKGIINKLGLFIVHIVLHVSYGLGFIKGVLMNIFHLEER